MVAARIPFLLGHAEIASLFGVKPQTSQVWRSEGTLPEPDLTASGNPYWLLRSVMSLDGGSGRQVTSDRLRAYKESLAGGYDVMDEAEMPIILGIKEVASLLGKDEVGISRWRNRGTLAEADLVLSRSPLWLLESIVDDAARRGRTVSTEALAEIKAGRREVQKPRGRKTPTSPPGKTRDLPLPPARSFQSDEQAEAAAFVVEVLAQGHSVVVRPKR